MSERTAAIAELYELFDREPEISGRLLVDLELEPSTRAAACSSRAPALSVAEKAVTTGPAQAEPPRARIPPPPGVHAASPSSSPADDVPRCAGTRGRRSFAAGGPEVMKDHETPISECPACGYVCDHAADLEECGRPNPGDVSVCINCAAAHVFGEDLELRKPTKEEEAQFPLEVARYQLAVRSSPSYRTLAR